MIARDHLPHAIILTGPRGAVKFTLAQMVAKAVNCLEHPLGRRRAARFLREAAATASELPRPTHWISALPKPWKPVKICAKAISARPASSSRPILKFW